MLYLGMQHDPQAECNEMAESVKLKGPHRLSQEWAKGKEDIEV